MNEVDLRDLIQCSTEARRMQLRTRLAACEKPIDDDDEAVLVAGLRETCQAGRGLRQRLEAFLIQLRTFDGMLSSAALSSTFGRT